MPRTWLEIALLGSVSVSMFRTHPRTTQSCGAGSGPASRTHGYFGMVITLAEVDSAIFSVNPERHRVGVDKIIWSTDYPHTVVLCPDGQHDLEAMMENVPAPEQKMIVSDNAKTLYRIK